MVFVNTMQHVTKVSQKGHGQFWNSITLVVEKHRHRDGITNTMLVLKMLKQENAASSKPAWATQQVLGQSRLQSETWLRKTKIPKQMKNNLKKKGGKEGRRKGKEKEELKGWLNS